MLDGMSAFLCHDNALPRKASSLLGHFPIWAVHRTLAKYLGEGQEGTVEEFAHGRRGSRFVKASLLVVLASEW